MLWCPKSSIVFVLPVVDLKSTIDDWNIEWEYFSICDIKALFGPFLETDIENLMRLRLPLLRPQTVRSQTDRHWDRQRRLYSHGCTPWAGDSQPISSFSWQWLITLIDQFGIWTRWKGIRAICPYYCANGRCYCLVTSRNGDPKHSIVQSWSVCNPNDSNAN